MNRTQLEQWQEEVAVERVALEAAFKRPHPPSPSTIDLRNFGVSCVSSLTMQSRREFVQGSLLPLLFGASWKVIDIFVERAWQTAGGASRPSIEAKVGFALANWSESLAPRLNGDLELARRTAHVYGGNKQLRHALTHRKLVSDPGGTISTLDGEYLTADELNAVCELALALISWIEGGFNVRVRSTLAWWKNQLVRLHRLEQMDEAFAPRPIDIVLINAYEEEGTWYVDTERACQKARSTIGGFPYAHPRSFAVA